MTQPGEKPASARELLLLRRGLVFLEPRGGDAGDDLIRAVEVELANLGYAVSTRLRDRLAASSRDELAAFRVWVLAVLSAALGANRQHAPLFRSFPDGVPRDTADLYLRKVLVHFAQAEDRPCLFCRRTGTTHVLRPCRHVVCDHCWDGASYSACPVCEHRVDRRSPFFLPSEIRALSATERVTFHLLDLGDDLEAEARRLFVSLCERRQPLSPDDRDALGVLLRDLRSRALAWLPEKIPVRENVAVVFGTLFGVLPADEVLPEARRFMTTATDVLRFLAVISGADASLQPESLHKEVKLADHQGRPLAITTWWQKLAVLMGHKPQPRRGAPSVYLAVEVRRFKMAKLSRPLRRALLAVLEGIPADRLGEDMMRHRSFWIWAGEFLHPGEHAARFPNVAAAFAILRRKAPDGTRAPKLRGFYSAMEAAIAAGDAARLVRVLAPRPGELARRLDLALRLAGSDAAANATVLEALRAGAPAFSTPVLLTLRSLLPTRGAPAARRLFWPKGQVAKGVSAPDSRATLDGASVAAAGRVVDAELLARLSTKPRFEAAIVDSALRDIVVPFNARRASRSAVDLPRGSRVAVPEGKTVRLFLHWCEPEKAGDETDLDLSVGLYDEGFTLVGVCSYYELSPMGKDGGALAVSGGDLREAPYPDGATELVDVHRGPALANGVRYAVMVVNAYAGMPFDRLERAFAGIMLRDSDRGAYFDPRTVELKFSLSGRNGIYMPLVLDLREGVLHWLDVYSEGQLAFNNLHRSNSAISRICPEMIAYFASGVRASMLDLALLHAAVRCDRVWLRGPEGSSLFVRRAGEAAPAFHARLVRGEADEPRARPPRGDGPPMLALLHRGDLDLSEGSAVYALFRERLSPTLAAADLVS